MAVARSRMQLVLSLLLVSILSISSSARADEPTAAPEDTVAAALTQQAEQRYRRGDYQGALERYLEAYRVSPRPELVFDAAQCHRRLGQHEEALGYYNEFLKLEPYSSHAEQVRVLMEDSRRAMEEEAAKPGPKVIALTASEDAPTAEPVPNWSAESPAKPGASAAEARDEDGARVKRRRRIAISVAVLATIAGGTTAALVAGRSNGDDTSTAATSTSSSSLGVVEWR